MAPNVGRGCFLCGSEDHDDCDINLDELTILGEKIGLSGDAFRAWLEEENAKEREARREEAEREARARETQLALAREVAAIEERNSLLRKRLLEAESAARARAPVHVESVPFMDPGSWSSDELNKAKDSFGSKFLKGRLDSSASGRYIEFYEEAAMPIEKPIDIHKAPKNEAKANHKPERSIASYDTMERSGSIESDALMQTDAEECTHIKHGHILTTSSREGAINIWRESHLRKCKKSSMGSSESASRAGMNETRNETSGMATEEGHMPTAGENYSGSSAESRATALVLLGMNEKVSTNNEPRKEQVFASLGGVSHAGETKCEAAEREWGRDLSKRTPERDEKNEQSYMSTAHVRVSLSDEKSLSSVTLCTAERIPFYMVQLLACRPKPGVSVQEWLGPKLRNLNVWWGHISSWHNSLHITHSSLNGKSKLCDCVEVQNAFLRSYGHAHVLSLRCKHVIDDSRLVWDAIT